MELPADDLGLAPVHLRTELLGSGYTDKGLARALRDGTLARPRRGAYVEGGVWRAAGREQRYLLTCRAAYLQARTEVVLSHSSALPLLGAPLWGLDLSESHLTRIDERNGRREAGIRQHAGRVLDGDVRTTYGVCHSSAVRAAIEVTTIAPTEAALVVVCSLLHGGRITVDDLRSRYEQDMTQWPYSLRTALVLRLATPALESVGEIRTWHLLWREGLPRPIPQYEVFDGGVLVARLDFALPEQGIWIEFDGRVKYVQHLREGETATDAVLREKRREEQVGELTGWRCLRVTWADLSDPVRLGARVRDLIESVARARRRAG